MGGGYRGSGGRFAYEPREERDKEGYNTFATKHDPSKEMDQSQTRKMMMINQTTPIQNQEDQ